MRYKLFEDYSDDIIDINSNIAKSNEKIKNKESEKVELKKELSELNTLKNKVDAKYSSAVPGLISKNEESLKRTGKQLSNSDAISYLEKKSIFSKDASDVIEVWKNSDAIEKVNDKIKDLDLEIKELKDSIITSNKELVDAKSNKVNESLRPKPDLGLNNLNSTLIKDIERILNSISYEDNTHNIFNGDTRGESLLSAVKVTTRNSRGTPIVSMFNSRLNGSSDRIDNDPSICKMIFKKVEDLRVIHANLITGENPRSLTTGEFVKKYTTGKYAEYRQIIGQIFSTGMYRNPMFNDLRRLEIEITNYIIQYYKDSESLF